MSPHRADKTEVTSRSAILPILMTCAGLAPGALGQVRPDLQRVDPGVEDVGPQQISLRSFEVDLRSPLGFDLIYEGMRHDPYAGPFAPGQRYLTRSSGAVNAVFPRSSYVPTRAGYAPEIPAGTIFYIGDPAEALRGPTSHAPGFGNQARGQRVQGADPRGARSRASAQIVGSAVDSRLDLSMPAEPAEAPRKDQTQVEPSPPEPAMRIMSIWGNDTYRSERVKRLIESAAELETDPDSASESPDVD